MEAQDIDYRARYDFICRASAKDNAEETITDELYHKLNQLTHKIDYELTELAEKGCPNNFMTIQQTLKIEVNRLREFCEFPYLATKIIIGIGGKFSAGKSTFINTLTGKKQLVTEIDPTTSLPTYLLKGEVEKVNAINIFNKKIDMSLEEFQSLTHDEKSKYKSHVGSLLTSVFISCPDFQWTNLALLDTPGYTKPDSQVHSERTDAAIARNQLNAAQFIVWLVSAEDGTIKQDDLNFLSSLHTKIPKLLLINKADTKTPDQVEDIIALTRQTLKDNEIPILDVIPVSRKKKHYSTDAVIERFEQWNKSSRELNFSKNFKRQFLIYKNFIDKQIYSSEEQLELLNQVLLSVDDESVLTKTEVMKGNLIVVCEQWQELAVSLNLIEGEFFQKLEVISGIMGVEFDSTDELEIEVIRDVAVEKNLSKAMQLKISNNQNHNFRQNLAKNIELIEEAQLKLAEDEYLKVRLNLAANPSLTENTQKALATDKNKYVRMKLTSNQGLTNLVRGILSNDSNAGVKSCLLARYGNLTTDEIAALTQAKYQQVKLNLEMNPTYHDATNVVPDKINSTDNDQKLDGNTVVKNIEETSSLLDSHVIPVETQKILATGDEDDINKLLKAHNIVEELQVKFTNTEVTNEHKVSLAENINITLNVQHILYEIDDVDINEALVKNSNLHPELQLKFIKHNRNTNIRNLLAINSALTEEYQCLILQNASESENTSEIEALAENPSLVEILQLTFASEESTYGIKTALARNIGITESTQHILVLDEDSYVRRCLAHNLSIVDTIQLCLCNDDEKQVRYALIENENIIDAAKEILADDIENKRREEKSHYANVTLFSERFEEEFDCFTESKAGVYFLDNIIEIGFSKHMKIMEKLDNFSESLAEKNQYLDTYDSILVIDTTLFGSLKNGLYIGRNSIAFKGTFSEFTSYPLDDVTSVRWDEDDNKICINWDEDISIVGTYEREVARRFSEMFNKYKEERDRILEGL